MATEFWGEQVSIFKYFEIFNYIRYFDLNCTLCIKYVSPQNKRDEKIAMIENIFAAYDHFFYHDIEFPQIKMIQGIDISRCRMEFNQGINEDFVKWRQWTYNNWSSRSDIWTIKDSAPQKKYITTSLVESREGFVDNLNRAISPEYVNILMETFSLNSSVVDLGDSRGFKTSKELIDKINYIRGSKFYVGSQVSWKDIARIFGIYVLILEPTTSF